MLHLLLYCCLLFLPTVSQEEEEPIDPDLAAKLAKFENAKQATSDSSNQAPAPAGVQIDWNKPWSSIIDCNYRYCEFYVTPVYVQNSKN